MKLLERAPFLQTLSEYAAEARSGDGRIVILSGESGMGKTALLEAFQQQEKGSRFLWGAGDGLHCTPASSFFSRRAAIPTRAGVLAPALLLLSLAMCGLHGLLRASRR